MIDDETGIEETGIDDNPDIGDMPLCCHQCGQAYFVEDDGTSHHSSDTGPDGIDWDADADHVPYGEPEGLPVHDDPAQGELSV